MAVVQGIREKVHLPLYDAVFVEPEQQLRDVDELDNSGTLKFFVNVQRRSKLETNLQSASLLPHYNTFEARAMRVVISDLPPEFPEDDHRQGRRAAGDGRGRAAHRQYRQDRGRDRFLRGQGRHGQHRVRHSAPDRAAAKGARERVREITLDIVREEDAITLIATA